jgi:EAL domain-containing protein (putative c-di-GMP-specific phosphodiesterase class I)
VVALGRNFNFNIIAEGVEKEYQLNILQELDCYIIQKYLFTKSLTVKDATRLV